MATKLNPYIGFTGKKANAALEFYHSVFGGELTVNLWKDSGMDYSEGYGDALVHGQLVTDNGLTIMAADIPPEMSSNPGSTVSLSLNGGPDEAEELTAFFNGLNKDASGVEPLTKAPWGDTFGMLTDQFGIAWMVNISG